MNSKSCSVSVTKLLERYNNIGKAVFVLGFETSLNMGLKHWCFSLKCQLLIFTTVPFYCWSWDKSLQKHSWNTNNFPVNFAKFLKTSFLQNTSGRLLLSFELFEIFWEDFFQCALDEDKSRWVTVWYCHKNMS